MFRGTIIPITGTNLSQAGVLLLFLSYHLISLFKNYPVEKTLQMLSEISVKSR